MWVGKKVQPVLPLIPLPQVTEVQAEASNSRLVLGVLPTNRVGDSALSVVPEEKGVAAARALRVSLLKHHKDPVIAILRPRALPREVRNAIHLGVAEVRNGEVTLEGAAASCILTLDGGGGMAFWCLKKSVSGFGWHTPVFRVTLDTAVRRQRLLLPLLPPYSPHSLADPDHRLPHPAGGPVHGAWPACRECGGESHLSSQ